MGMYTELYLAVRLWTDTPDSILNWLELCAEGECEIEKTIDDWSKWRAKVANASPPSLKGTRLETIGNSSSYYFDGIPFIKFKKDNLYPNRPMYFLTTRFDIKNYNGEIRLFLDVIQEYVETNGHVGHIRYEEDDIPTILICSNGTIY